MSFIATQRTFYEGSFNFPQLQIVGNKIYYTWFGYKTSGDFSHIWTGEMNLDGTGFTSSSKYTSTHSAHEYSLVPQFQVFGDKIYHVWCEDINRWIIFTGEMNINDTAIIATQRTNRYYDRLPQLQIYGDKVYYVWQQRLGSCWRIFTAVMNLDGTNFIETQRTFDGHSDEYPQFQIYGDKVYYVWVKTFLGTDGKYYSQIITAVMNLDGTNFIKTQRTFDNYKKLYPQLQVYGDKIYYVWVKVISDSIWELWTGEMNLDGTNFIATYRITINNYSSHAIEPQFQIYGNKIYHVWDKRLSQDTWELWTGEMNLDGTNFIAAPRIRSGYNFRVQFQIAGDKIYYVFIKTTPQSKRREIWTATLDIEIPSLSKLKHSTGAIWKPAKRVCEWDGTQWIEKHSKDWAGSEWKQFI